MAVELGVICPEVPEPEPVSRLAGPLMSMVLRSPLVHALWDEDRDDVWTIRWDSVSVQVIVSEFGQHEFGDNWYLTVAQGERGIDLSFLLMLVTAAAASVAVGGRVVDDASLVGGGQISGGDLLTRAAGGPERSVENALKALGSHVWGS